MLLTARALLILQNPSAEFVTRPVVHSFSPDQTVVSVSLPVSQDAFLPPGATITLSVVRAEVTSPAELAGGLGDASAPVQLVVGDDVANPVVFFDQRSLSASVNDCKYCMVEIPTTADTLRIVLILWVHVH